MTLTKTGDMHKRCPHTTTKVIRLTPTKADGQSHPAGVAGVLLAVYADRVEVYRTAARKVLRYDAVTSTLTSVENLEEALRDVLPDDAVIEAMAALGIRPLSTLASSAMCSRGKAEEQAASNG